MEGSNPSNAGSKRNAPGAAQISAVQNWKKLTYLSAVGLVAIVVPVVDIRLYIREVALDIADRSITGNRTNSASFLPYATNGLADKTPLSTSDCLRLRGSSGTWHLDWDYADRNEYPNYGSYGDFHLAQQNFTATPDQPFRLATAWRWQDDHCPVAETSLTTFCLACRTLDITRVLLVGDSLSMEFRHSLLSLLGSPPQGSEFTFNGCGRVKSIKCGQDGTLPPFTIGIQWYRRSPAKDFQHLSSPAGRSNQQYNFVADNPNRTAIVANIGSWISDMGNYTLGFDSLIDWIDSFDPNKVVVFYRETLPGHWPCSPGVEGNDTVKTYDWIKPVNASPFESYDDYHASLTEDLLPDRFQWDEFEGYNEYSQILLARRNKGGSNNTNDIAPIHWLNVFNSTVLRRDGHIGFGDCLHYYMPGPIDWWVHFFHSSLLDLADLELANRSEMQKNNTAP